MFQVFAINEADASHYMALISGDHANLLARWLRNEEGVADSFSIQDVPVIHFSANDPANFQVADWTFGTLHCDKTISSTWSWGRGKNKLPPRPTYTYRSFMLGVIVGPRYRCVGFSNTGVPQLDLSYCDGQGGYWILMMAQVRQIAELLQTTNGDKRKFEATFPTEACHMDPHNHRKEDDDSPPPPSQAKRTRV